LAIGGLRDCGIESLNPPIPQSPNPSIPQSLNQSHNPQSSNCQSSILPPQSSITPALRQKKARFRGPLDESPGSPALHGACRKFRRLNLLYGKGRARFVSRGFAPVKRRLWSSDVHRVFRNYSAPYRFVVATPVTGRSSPALTASAGVLGRGGGLLVSWTFGLLDPVTPTRIAVCVPASASTLAALSPTSSN